MLIMITKEIFEQKDLGLCMPYKIDFGRLSTRLVNHLANLWDKSLPESIYE